MKVDLHDGRWVRLKNGVARKKVGQREGGKGNERKKDKKKKKNEVGCGIALQEQSRERRRTEGKRRKRGVVEKYARKRKKERGSKGTDAMVPWQSSLSFVPSSFFPSFPRQRENVMWRWPPPTFSSLGFFLCCLSLVLPSSLLQDDRDTPRKVAQEISLQNNKHHHPCQHHTALCRQEQRVSLLSSALCWGHRSPQARNVLPDKGS